MALERIMTVFGDEKPHPRSFPLPSKETDHHDNYHHHTAADHGRQPHKEVIAHIYQPYWMAASTELRPSPSKPAAAEQSDSLMTTRGYPTTDCTGTHRRQSKPKTGFLDLPTEIRLQIYETVNQLNPVLPRQLDLGYPDYHPKPYFAELVLPVGKKTGGDDDDGGDKEKEDDDEDSDWTWIDFDELGLASSSTKKLNKVNKITANEVRKKEPSGGDDGDNTTPTPALGKHHQHRPCRRGPLLSPHRPRGYIPQALLRTCRRVYREARCVPFNDNEFVFATWFSTGSSSALAFIGGLRAWQWAAMRHVRLEIPLNDIDGSNRPHLANWQVLCERWAFGLRGLRLRIVHLPNGMVAGDGDGGSGGGEGEGEGGRRVGPLAAICPAPGGTSSGSESYPWIDGGLRKLEKLQRLEVELKTSSLTNDQKLDWCEGLRGRLAASRRMMGKSEAVDVVCVRAKGL